MQISPNSDAASGTFTHSASAVCGVTETIAKNYDSRNVALCATPVAASLACVVTRLRVEPGQSVGKSKCVAFSNI